MPDIVPQMFTDKYAQFYLGICTVSYLKFKKLYRIIYKQL